MACAERKTISLATFFMGTVVARMVYVDMTVERDGRLLFVFSGGHCKESRN